MDMDNQTDPLPRKLSLTLPVIAGQVHSGKALELDRDRETIIVRGPMGEPLGAEPWAEIIDYILLRARTRMAPETPVSRAKYVVKVESPLTPGTRLISRATGIAESLMFVETITLLPVGSPILIEFAPLNSQTQWARASGVVAWVCPCADYYSFGPGLGIRFATLVPEPTTEEGRRSRSGLQPRSPSSSADRRDAKPAKGKPATG